METEMKKIIRKIRNGDYITNKELDLAIEHYSQLEKLLMPFGEIYHLVRKDVSMELHRLRGYKEARKRK